MLLTTDNTDMHRLIRDKLVCLRQQKIGGNRCESVVKKRNNTENTDYSRIKGKVKCFTTFYTPRGSPIHFFLSKMLKTPMRF